MSDRGRRRAFLLAALALASAIGSLVALHPRGQAETERSRAANRVVGETPLRNGGGDRSGRARSRDPRREERRHAERSRKRRARAGVQARRFLAAFLSYQRGSLDSRSRRRLLQSATPHVIAYLLHAPPRGGREGKAARVDALHLYGPSRGAVKASALLSYWRSDERGLLEFVLRERSDGWRVTVLYP
jgi:hypothetical protein